METQHIHSYEKSPVYEYGIGFKGEVHRDDLTFTQAKDFIKHMHKVCRDFGGDPGAFYMIRRPLGEWRKFV